MVKELIFGLAGGLGLFIYGIYLMGEGLQNTAGDKMRRCLNALTKNPFFGMITGAFITSIVQSSSAITVMVLGFVNAGLMTLAQAIGVIFGVNIGTTITAQIIAFKLTEYALPAVAIGAALYLFVNKRAWKYFGLFVLGFGVLFLGLNIMTAAIKPISGDPAVQNAFVNFSHNPLLGVLTGLIVTAILQSSSVTTGMVIALASTGLFDLRAAIPMIFGCNIGTCITAIIASVGTTISARRTALVHVLFNVTGTLIFLPALPFFYNFVVVTSNDISRQIANAHTLFNVLNTIIFIPFTGVFAKVVTKILPGKDTLIDTRPQYLEKHLLHTPAIALEASMKEVIRMNNLACDMINDAMKGFRDNDIKSLELIPKKEVAVDNLQEAITNYLMELMQKELSPEVANKIPSLLHSVNDIERIGDHSENLMELSERRISLSLPFTKEALQEIEEMYSLIMKMGNGVAKALDSNNADEAKLVLDMEKQVNKFTQQLKDNHIERLSKGKCKVLSGIIFLDMISNFEKIGDHLTNVAQAIIGKLRWASSMQTDMLH